MSNEVKKVIYDHPPTEKELQEVMMNDWNLIIILTRETLSSTAFHVYFTRPSFRGI